MRCSKNELRLRPNTNIDCGKRIIWTHFTHAKWIAEYEGVANFTHQIHGSLMVSTCFAAESGYEITSQSHVWETNNGNRVSLSDSQHTIGFNAALPSLRLPTEIVDVPSIHRIIFTIELIHKFFS